ncbi:putative enzyme [Paenibacillus popilliae ATCC 14706]|uniref:Putative enzyme n=1 Tax=Paenibacillus popilliae ATCC 14706 TaxID=1212764 RepID=M9M4F2_PAEPP|nr:putative enzyme [Paenibacillus popilliae ATCC 14706]
MLAAIVAGTAYAGWQQGWLFSEQATWPHPPARGLPADASDGSSPGAAANQGAGADTEHPDQDASLPGSEPKEEPRVRLAFAGDVMTAGRVEDVVKVHGYDFPFVHAKRWFQEADIAAVNLETPLTVRGVPAKDKEFVYKSSPQMAQAMIEAGIDVVNLANNHSMDQGEEGLLDTFAALKDVHLPYVGAGHNAEEAFTPVMFESQGIKLAFLGFTRVVPEVSWYAGKNKPGLATTYDGMKEKAAEAVAKAKEEADLVVVIAHWGKEKVDFPEDYQRELARLYIDAGADLIVGGHPHVLQGLEQYKGKWIAYSLGNFIFTRAMQPATWETVILQAECTDQGKCELAVIPFYTELGQAVPLEGEAGQAVLQRLENLSEQVSIDAEGRVEEMLFSLDTLIEYTARHYGLGEGDLLFTGTPAGSDRCRQGIAWK